MRQSRFARHQSVFRVECARKASDVPYLMDALLALVHLPSIYLPSVFSTTLGVVCFTSRFLSFFFFSSVV